MTIFKPHREEGALVNLRTFDLNLLRVFEAIYRDGSVSRAADQLGVSQSAVSNALNRLRYQLDDPLFVRSSQGMDPTPKAAQLAATLLEGMTTIRSALVESATFDPTTSRRRFTLLMTDVGEITFLPTILARLSREAPNVDLVVMEQGLERYGELLDNGTVDLAIGRIALLENFMSESIHSSPFVVLLSRDNPYLRWGANGEPMLDLDAYLAAPHVQVKPRGMTGDLVEQALRGYPRRRMAMSIPHATVLPVIIENTYLLATIPQVCANHLLANSSLISVPPPFEIERNSVSLWWHKRNHKDPGHRWLRDAFAERWQPERFARKAA